MPDIARIEAGIRALEAQRDALGGDAVDSALAPLRQRLGTDIDAFSLHAAVRV